MSEQPIPRPSDGVVPVSRNQRQGRVMAVLDGDAHLHVWEPNRDDDPLDIDLTDRMAAIIDIGLDAPPAPEPHWSDRGGTTLIVSLDPGARGNITAHGHDISPEAATKLAANGFVQTLPRHHRASIRRNGGRRHRGDRKRWTGARQRR